MDSALLKEREAFKRRAMAVPTVENKAAKRADGSRDAKDKKKSAALGAQSQSAKAKQEMAQMKAASAATRESQENYLENCLEIPYTSKIGGMSGSQNVTESKLTLKMTFIKIIYLNCKPAPAASAPAARATSSACSPRLCAT